jgi:hypothetical protein
MSEPYLTTQEDTWVDQLKSVVIACAGNNINRF